jgi:nucleoside-diphosphate-sugar epimerase
MSSLAAYGSGSETTFNPIKSTDTPNPITSYGKSKLKAEQFLFQQNSMPFLIFRPTGVYGPRDTGYYKFIKSINKHIEIYLGTSHQRLSFIYVKDLVSLIFKALPSEIANRAYFVTDGRNYTSKQFASITKKILNKKTIRIVFPRFFIRISAVLSEKFAQLANKATLFTVDKYNEIIQQNWACDASETFTDFDFTPKYNLYRGVEETVDWYKENRWL